MCCGPSQCPGATGVAVGTCGTMLYPSARNLALDGFSVPMSSVDEGSSGTVRPLISSAAGNATPPPLCLTFTQNGKRGSRQLGSTQEPRLSIHASATPLSKKTVIFTAKAVFVHFLLSPKTPESLLRWSRMLTRIRCPILAPSSSKTLNLIWWLNHSPSVPPPTSPSPMFPLHRLVLAPRPKSMSSRRPVLIGSSQMHAAVERCHQTTATQMHSHNAAMLVLHQ